MRLIESTSKDILARYGLLSPAHQLCASADEASDAASSIGGDVYVKAQIPYGDRAGLGLVARAAGAHEAARLAAEQLSAVVDGFPVRQVLVEASATAELSAYLSVHVDGEQAARVLRIGLGGGSHYDASAADLKAVLPREGMEAYEIRSLLGRLGLARSHREAMVQAVRAVIRAASEWHAYTVEVNPLFVTAGGPLAVDAKMELDDYSLGAVPDRSIIGERAESERERSARVYQTTDHRGSFRFVQLVGEAEAGAAGGFLVGSHSVGGGESLVVFDALHAVGIQPANYCDTSGAPSREKVAFAARTIASQPHIQGYFFSSCIANQPLSVTANGLVDGFREAGWSGPTVVRIAGNQEEEAKAIVRDWAGMQGVDAVILGREVDEWEAARRLAALLDAGSN